ncbi:MAG: hypothetical protein M1819_005222 [Sarea resinae]|nr:MAG: hypothetical protein M1819_005222 [Sarea resinae]
MNTSHFQDVGQGFPASEVVFPAAEGHRPKRIKIEEPAGELNSLENIPEPSVSENGLPTMTGITTTSEEAEYNGENQGFDIDALAALAAQSAMADLNGNMAMAEPSQASDYTSQDQMNGTGTNGARNVQGQASAEIDFSSAPSDPTELALWVAKQISNIRNEDRDSYDSEDLVARRRLMAQGPAIYNHRLDEDDDPAKAAERERIREENRERKKRWRQSNAERNKDNDLRCRINKRAKKLYGIGQSAEKSAWMESEFNKRRTKRENKEQVRTYGGDVFPGFAFAPGFGSTLFPAPGVGPNGETNAAGLLLANALLGVGNSGGGPNAEAANALKAALEKGAVDPRPFTEALRTMASNPEIMSGINAVLGVGYDEDGDGNSGDENMDTVIQSTEQHNGEGEVQVPENTNDDSNEIIKALNAATAILNEMNESNTDGGFAEGLSNAINGFNAVTESMDLRQDGASAIKANDHGLDQSQIDALLALANGGSLNGDGEDNVKTEMPPTSELQPDRTTPQPDDDITATLQRIVQQLMAEREGQGGPADQNEHAGPEDSDFATRHGETNLSPMPDPTTSINTKDPATTLSSLLHGAGMSINTVIPAAQSHATSQLYSRLSTRARSSTPSGGINPAHASAYGSTAQMNQKLLSRPNGNRQKVQSASPKLNGRGGSPDPRRLEEERKVKSFGFPPMPGKRFLMKKDKN